jgi:mitogen-activated protein kinase 1/3
MIFDVIGTPTDEEIDALARDAAAYVRKQYPPKGADELSKRFPGSAPATLDLMARCLIFDPAKRMRVEEAVKHDAFKGVQSNAADNMPDGLHQVELEFEQEPDLNEKALRKWFLFYADKYKQAQ